MWCDGMWCYECVIIWDLKWYDGTNEMLLWCAIICYAMTCYEMFWNKKKLRNTIFMLWFESYVMSEMMYESLCMHIIECDMWWKNEGCPTWLTKKIWGSHAYL